MERELKAHTVEIGPGEARATALFRRWSDLSSAEMKELRRLWDERMRLAKLRARLSKRNPRARLTGGGPSRLRASRARRETP